MNSFLRGQYSLFFALLMLWPSFLLEAGHNPVSFRESQEKAASFDSSYYKQDPHWRLLTKLYTAHQNEYLKATCRIPRYLHFIFTGGSLPDYVDYVIQSWKKQHPTWTIYIWMDRDVPTFQMKNQEAFEKALNPSEKAAIWSYEILDRFGGVYVDVNCECLRSIEKIRKKCSFFAGTTHARTALISNKLIGARANHPILKSCIAAIQVGSGDDITENISQRAGADLFTRCFFADPSQHTHAAIFPVTFFSPFPYETIPMPRNTSHAVKTWRQKESYALTYLPGRRSFPHRKLPGRKIQ